MNKIFKNKNLKAKRKIANTSKGITLIALIITIIVLLILAVVAIRAVQGDGILAHARNARDKWSEATANEEAMLGNLTNYITEQSENNPDGGGSGGQPSSPSDPAKTMAEAQSDDMFNKTVNSPITDEYGNKVVVPAGFKILVDTTTTYEDSSNPHVTDGIVIQDSQGNEFVWVPIGEIKKDKNGATENIIFGRYSWNGSTGTVKQSETEGGGFEAEVGIGDFTEKLQNSESKNAKAKNIIEFCGSVITNGGYYIGRYEAGDSIATSNGVARTGTSSTSTPGTLVCKKDQYVYVWILQIDASAACQDMYTGKPFTSDLVNSYAWDTAIEFIQKCGTESDAKTYASLNKSTKFGKTGENGDQYRNINDMSGNAYEWTTETCTSYMGSTDSTPRGGFFNEGYGEAFMFASNRFSTEGSNGAYSFRPLLYLN